ncbi:hypothetical protein ZIOFF_069942 [Zingiber officinale]|uniref:cellulase n=1 Tax=Zingiber officinale TaxID=94328 RepID=A0A8J5ES65_ZINOF|nr:hypothetical protein ZIOFF_069942 [Zingiber officinale]
MFLLPLISFARRLITKRNNVSWMGNSGLRDGLSDQSYGRSLSSGFYDVGDIIKLTFPLSFSMTMLNTTNNIIVEVGQGLASSGSKINDHYCWMRLEDIDYRCWLPSAGLGAPTSPQRLLLLRCSFHCLQRRQGQLPQARPWRFHSLEVCL